MGTFNFQTTWRENVVSPGLISLGQPPCSECGCHAGIRLCFAPLCLPLDEDYPLQLILLSGRDFATGFLRWLQDLG